MTIEKLADIIGEENLAVVQSELDIHLGIIIDLEVAVGGLVHHVLRVEGESGSAYLKIRGNFYAGLPDIQTRPEHIDDEKSSPRKRNCIL